MAPALLGCVLARRVGRNRLLGRIVETEAYVGEHDLACHARAGRTSRTEVMYGEPGHAYVYLIYGIHQMLNCVCGPGAEANAVLVRAVEPALGSAPWLHGNARGPGNVCKAFGVELAHNRADLCDPRGDLVILPRTGRRAHRARAARGGGICGKMGRRAAALLRREERPPLPPFAPRLSTSSRPESSLRKAADRGDAAAR